MQRHHKDIPIFTLPTATCSNQLDPQSCSINSTTVTSKPATKWSKDDPHQVELNSLLTDFIINSLQPLSRTEDKYLRAFVNKAQPAYTFPGRKHLSSSLVPAKVDNLRTIIVDQLSKLSDHSISVTVDIWSSRSMRSYIGITAHWMQDYTLQSAMLACQRFTGSHTGEKIITSFNEITAEYSISGKLLTIVSDSAANMVKAFTFPWAELESDSSSEDEDGDTDELLLVESDNLLQELPEQQR